MFQRFDCAVWFGMISRGQYRFNLLFWLITRENYVFARMQPWIGCRDPILNGPGNNGTMITSSGKSNGGWGLPPCTSSSGTSRYSASDCACFSNLYSGVVLCKRLIWEESSISTKEDIQMFMSCHSIQRSMFALYQDDQACHPSGLAALSRSRCQQLDEGRKWTGIWSLFQLVIDTD